MQGLLLPSSLRYVGAVIVLRGADATLCKFQVTTLGSNTAARRSNPINLHARAVAVPSQPRPTSSLSTQPVVKVAGQRRSSLAPSHVGWGLPLGFLHLTFHSHRHRADRRLRRLRSYKRFGLRMLFPVLRVTVRTVLSLSHPILHLITYRLVQSQ